MSSSESANRRDLAMPDRRKSSWTQTKHKSRTFTLVSIENGRGAKISEIYQCQALRTSLARLKESSIEASVYVMSLKLWAFAEKIQRWVGLRHCFQNQCQVLALDAVCAFGQDSKEQGFCVQVAQLLVPPFTKKIVWQAGWPRVIFVCARNWSRAVIPPNFFFYNVNSKSAKILDSVLLFTTLCTGVWRETEKWNQSRQAKVGRESSHSGIRII